MSVPDRRARLDRAHRSLSIRRQCQLLGMARSGVYRTPAPANDNDPALMRQIDELFTAWPFLGSRRLARMPQDDGPGHLGIKRHAPRLADSCGRLGYLAAGRWESRRPWRGRGYVSERSAGPGR
jgi:putative transposase